MALHRYIRKPYYHNVYNISQDIPYEIPTTIQYYFHELSLILILFYQLH